jgi:hypothetical protein
MLHKKCHTYNILEKKGKPFSDVEIINECIVEAMGCLDPEKN